MKKPKQRGNAPQKEHEVKCIPEYRIIDTEHDGKGQYDIIGKFINGILVRKRRIRVIR